MKKKNVVIIFGGVSVEHEVSIVSANSILNNINIKKYRPIGIYMTKNGGFRYSEIIINNKKNKEFKPTNSVVSFEPGNKKCLVIDGCKKIIPEIFFPIIHGTGGEDGSIQGLIRTLGVPFVGCDILGSAITMNKVLTKELIASHKINTAKYIKVDKKLEKFELNKINKELGYPCFVKASNLGSSVGIFKVNTEEEAISKVKKALKYSKEVFIEESIINAKEIEVSILDTSKELIISIPGEINPSSEFYDYNAKYIDGKSELSIPSKSLKNDKKLINYIKRTSEEAFKILKCEGLVRVDFLYGSTLKNKSKKVYLSEINSIPGFTEISMYPKLLEYDGINYSSLIDKLIQFSLARFKKEHKLIKSIN